MRTARNRSVKHMKFWHLAVEYICQDIVLTKLRGFSVCWEIQEVSMSRRQIKEVSVCSVSYLLNIRGAVRVTPNVRHFRV